MPSAPADATADPTAATASPTRPGVLAQDSPFGVIEVRRARENNLRDVSLDLPKRKLTVFTGVSGSGKSSLVFGTIAAESQRLINETFTAFVQNFLPHYGRPDVDSLQNLSAAIVVGQERMGGNARSTVGTVTDAWTMLRILYSRLGTPPAGISSAYSFNDPQGMCPTCEGIGKVSALDVDGMVDRDLSLDEGAITLPNFGVDTWYWRIFAASGLFDPAKKLRDYTPHEWAELTEGEERKLKIGGINITYEGLLPKFRRTFLSKDVEQLQPAARAAVERAVTFAPCPECGGSRLNAAARTSLVDGVAIHELAALQVSDLADFVARIGDPAMAPLLANLRDLLGNLVDIGLGYLSLDRVSNTLSGGEAQRVKMVRHLGSSLTDVTYIFDEPTVGLHAHDVQRLNRILLRLRDKGNTVLVVEHKPDVMAIADHVVDMGPGAGRDGGHVVYEGDVPGLLASGTLTGEHFARHQSLRETTREPTGVLRIEHANLHNLRDVSVGVPLGVLTAVTGVAGSGKSSLIHGCLPRSTPDAGEVVFIDQNLPRGSRRSNPASYTGMLDPIRKAFAKANGVNAALFSANSKGACPECKGLGLIWTDLAFMDGVASVCEACGGERFTAEVLTYALRGRNISDVLGMSVVQALEFFTEKPVRSMLDSLERVGLGYVTLGQPLSTLSGGERQRVKLAIEMARPGRIYVLDELTSGLHMHDVDRLIGVLDRLVEDGNTVIVVEHNLDVVLRADRVIDLGPGAGHDGGRVVFEGTPAGLAREPGSVTGEHLRLRLER